MPVVEGDSFDANPKRNLRRKGSGDYRLPTLDDDHPIGKMVGSVVQNSPDIFFIFKSELETVVTQVRADCSTLEMPFTGKRREEGPHSLLFRVREPPYQGESIFLD